MSWLDDPGATGAKLREGFRAARERTGDELTRRRIWAQVAYVRRPPPRRAWRLPVVALIVGATLGSLVFLTWPSGRGASVPVLSNDHRASGAQNEPAAEAFLAGPKEVRTGANETMRVRLRSGARVALSTHTQLVVSADDAPEVKLGRVSLEVPKQAPGAQFRLTAGPYKVVVIGTRFTVTVGSQNVGVEVQEGVVQVQRAGQSVRLEAGQTWTGWLVAPPQERQAVPASRRVLAAGSMRRGAALPLPLVAPSGSSSLAPPASGLAKQAREALRNGDADRALELLKALSMQPGPGGENALYEMGRIWRDHKRQPRKALEIWSGYKFAHPAGLLRPEIELSLIETYADLGDHRRALAEADAFVARYPTSERKAEVERLRQTLLDRDDQTKP